jgi:GAF domain-containing protein
MPVPSSSNITDSARLAALERYDVLDTPPEPAFDDIVELARQFCGMPIALVSLVTESRQWFKAKNGLDLCETPLTQSVCAHVVAEGTMQVIPDLAQDVRTQDNPLVSGEPHLGFYAGAPSFRPTDLYSARFVSSMSCRIRRGSASPREAH